MRSTRMGVGQYNIDIMDYPKTFQPFFTQWRLVTVDRYFHTVTRSRRGSIWIPDFNPSPMCKNIPQIPILEHINKNRIVRGVEEAQRDMSGTRYNDFSNVVSVTDLWRNNDLMNDDSRKWTTLGPLVGQVQCIDRGWSMRWAEGGGAHCI